MWWIWVWVGCSEPSCRDVDWTLLGAEGCQSADQCCLDGECWIQTFDGSGAWDCSSPTCREAKETAAVLLCSDPG